MLGAANELFYSEGVHTVGIDRVIEQAGVAKASLYNTFGSKDELVRAYLETRHTSVTQRIMQAVDRYDTSPGAGTSSSSRVILIVLIGLVVLGALTWLIWRASSQRPPSAQRTTTQPVAPSTAPAETGTVTPAVTPAPAAAASIRVTPALQDYGIIRRGTRAVRQFELTNNGTIPITIEVARSACRCLYYEYNAKKKIQPNAHETITVTVDAARAKSPAIDEQLAVTAKEDPTATATIGIRATIK